MKGLAVFFVGAALMAQTPVKIDYACATEDLDAFGLSCAPDDPCAILLELNSIESVGAKIFVAGDLHTETTTLYGVLLGSEDGGATWSEPVKRIRAAALEQVQFVDSTKGWVSGQSIEPLPRDPFLLITGDGGKTWRQKMMFDDSHPGSVAQFWFDSATAGQVVLDHEAEGRVTHEVYQTGSGGEGWELEQSTTRAVTLHQARAEAWRLHADGKNYQAQRRTGSGWETVASFAIRVTECK